VRLPSWLSRTVAAIRKYAAPSDLSPISARYGGGPWYPLVREPYAGAWQRNDEQTADTVLAYFAVYACVTLIASDIGKLCLRLVVQDADGIWTETENPAYSPVLRKPNRYQTTAKFAECWIASKLLYGNAYILKQRDARGVVTGLYGLNPQRVRVLVSPDGGIYYELMRDDLAELQEGTLIVPASEIIHDLMVPLYHPLIGVSPITACGLAAVQGLSIQQNSTTLFAKGSRPGGVLSAPGAIKQEHVDRIEKYWNERFTGENIGKIVVVGDGLKYEGLTISPVDAQLIEQLKWTAENVCSCFHVPGYMIGVGTAPAYGSVEPLVQQYYSQCLQSLIVNFERALDDGLGILQKVQGTQYGTEFDIDDLIWMDTRTRADAATKASGTLSPNEARKKYYGMPPVAGGDSPMAQQQYYSLESLAKRDAADPFAKPTPAPVAAPPVPPPNEPPPPPTRAALDAAIRRRLQEAA
jgi:HK97 family phage portal protein